MPGRLHVPDAAPLLDSGEKRNSWRCRGCCRSGGLPAFCVLALPRAATGAGALFVVVVRRPWQPWRRWSWCRLPRCSAAAPTSSDAAGRPGEVFCAGPRRPPGPVRRVAAPWRGRNPLWCSPLILQRTGAAARQHRPQAPAASPRKENTPETPCRPVAAVARAAPGVAGGSRGGPSEAAVPAGTDASTAPPLPLVPVCCWVWAGAVSAEVTSLFRGAVPSGRT